jgi:hypothetical protein
VACVRAAAAAPDLLLRRRQVMERQAATCPKVATTLALAESPDSRLSAPPPFAPCSTSDAIGDARTVITIAIGEQKGHSKKPASAMKRGGQSDAKHDVIAASFAADFAVDAATLHLQSIGVRTNVKARCRDSTIENKA